MSKPGSPGSGETRRPLFHPVYTLSFPYALDAGDVVRVQRLRQSEEFVLIEECDGQMASLSAAFSPNALLEITNIH
jgi:hypothetical protein